MQQNGISDANQYLRVWVTPEGRMFAEEKLMKDSLFGKHVGDNDTKKTYDRGKEVELDMDRVILMLREQIRDELLDEINERNPNMMPGQAEYEANRAADIMVDKLLEGRTHQEAKVAAGLEKGENKEVEGHEQEGPVRGQRRGV